MVTKKQVRRNRYVLAMLAKALQDDPTQDFKKLKSRKALTSEEFYNALVNMGQIVDGFMAAPPAIQSVVFRLFLTDEEVEALNDKAKEAVGVAPPEGFEEVTDE